MSLQISAIYSLLLSLAATGAPAASTVCGTAEAADGAALPAAARAELVPLERGYDWGLEVLGGRTGAAPETTAGLEDGRYCLAAPRAGMWEVVVRAPGFVPLTYSPLAVTEPRELPPARLPRDAGLRVTVRSTGGEPSGDVWVVAGPAEPKLWAGVAGDGWSPAMRAGRTGGDGRVTLPRAPGEELGLKTHVPGSAATATARGDGSAGDVLLELPRPAGRRSIEVRGDGDEALPGVLVVLAAHGWPVALSDAEGRLSLAVGPRASPRLLLEGGDGRRRVVQLPEPSDPGSEVTTLTLSRTPAVRGRVVDGGRRQGLPGALVWLGPDPGFYAVTGAGGEYALPSGGRERLRLQAEAAGFLPQATVAGPEDLADERAPDLVFELAASASGRVADADGSPLDGVHLEAVPEAPAGRPGGVPAADAASQARSDSEGRFELARLRPSTAYQVVARRPGFAALTVPGVVVSPGRGPADLGTLVLRPGARIEGRVTDTRGGPLANAEVRARTAAGPPARGEADRLRERPPDAVAGPDGRFVLKDLRPRQPLHLLATLPGYLPAWTLGVEAPSAEPLTVVLEEAARLSGFLVDEEGGAVAGAQVGLRWPGPPPGTVGLEPRRGDGSRSTRSGERGEFSFEELASGEVEIYARADGFLPAEPTSLELAPGAAVTDVRLVVRRGAIVEGRVYDPRGEPLDGARLRAGNAEAASDAEGRYRLSGLPPGVMGLYAHHPDYRSRAQEIHVEPGVNAVDIVLEEGWSLAGRTVDEAGDPVPGTRVELRSESPRARNGYVAVSGRDGGFRVVVSEEGSYRLTATREGFAPREVTGIEVGSASAEGIEVTLARGASVVGRLLGLEPEDLAWVKVEARKEDGRESAETAGGTVDPGGRYAIHDLSPGDWRIRAVLGGGRRQAEAMVAVEPRAREVERDLEFGAGLRLTGLLLYSGEPIAGAHVGLNGLDVTGTRAVMTGHDGAFRIDDLAAGRYRLDVHQPARALSYVEDLELTADQELVLELEAVPLVGAVISATTDEPMEDALVYVYKLLANGETGSLTTVPTDAEGGFVVAHVTAGRYLVAARKDGYAPAEQSIEVTAGAPPAPVLLRLAAAGGVTLTVRFDSGEVPSFVTVSAFDAAGNKRFTDTRYLTDRGYVSFEQLPAGTWNLLVSAEGGAPAWISVTAPGYEPGVVLSHAAPLVVRVPALMEAGAAGTLTLAGEDGEPFFQVEPGGAIRSQWTVSAGLVTLTNVPAGVWSVRVDGARGGTWIGTAVTDGRAPSQVSLE